MQGTMMQLPLTINQILERGKQIFGTREIVSRQPDKSLHLTSYAALQRRCQSPGAGS